MDGWMDGWIVLRMGRRMDCLRTSPSTYLPTRLASIDRLSYPSSAVGT